jgi:RNA-directed DNA polymerase
VDNLLGAWREFLCGKRRRKDVAEFSLHLMDHITELHQELSEKLYRHGGYHAFKVNDPKPRDIHKASVKDRLVHHALYRILYPYFDRKFIHDSYSCRIGKGTQRAINRFRDYGQKVSKNHSKTAWVLKCDIRKFFASIDHNVLKKILKKYIADKDTIWLLDQIIDSYHESGDIDVGLPLGNLTASFS